MYYYELLIPTETDHLKNTNAALMNSSLRPP